MRYTLVMSPGERADLRAWVPALAGRSVLVIGDLMLDRYILTTPLRASRERPVLITAYEGEELRPGGAANVAANLRALGAEVLLVGWVGIDPEGDALAGALAQRGVEVEALVRAPGPGTITKTRITVGGSRRPRQQVLRIDRDPRPPLAAGLVGELERRALERVPRVDAVLLSDYDLGTITAEIGQRLIATARGRVIAVDSRRQVDTFRGATFATPNEEEAEAAVGFRFRTTEELERGGRILLERLAAPAVMITRGDQGLALFEPGRARVDLPALGPEHGIDVEGAGDTAIAAATLARAAGAPFECAARLATLAAGVAVAKWGVATCEAEELARAAERHR